MVVEGQRVYYVGADPPSGVADADVALEWGSDVPDDVTGFDCLLCPAEAVATLRERAPAVPIVAVVGEDDTATDVALDAGATDVVDRDAPASVYGSRVRNAVARTRLASVETELDEKQNLLDTIFTRVPIHLYVKDAEARHVRVSHAYLEDPETFPGQRDVDLVDSLHTRRSYADDVHVIETGEPIIDKEEHLTDFEKAGWTTDHYLEQYDSIDPPDVTEEWVLTSKVPRYDDDGNVVGLVGITRDISERKQYQRQLEAQNERLDEFASIVSHDLRNPLNVADGYLELTRADCDSPYLDRIDNSLQRMEAIIDDVLTLARQGKVVESTDLVDLATVVEASWHTVDGERATLETEPLGAVRADESRLRRLLENLFDNSVEHGSADVTVRVGMLADGFFVEDDGPGIPSDRSRKVFEHGHTDSAQGTGFGLSIVESIAEAHGWNVALEESTAGGARFAFTGVDVVRDSDDPDTGSQTDLDLDYDDDSTASDA